MFYKHWKDTSEWDPLVAKKYFACCDGVEKFIIILGGLTFLSGEGMHSSKLSFSGSGYLWLITDLFKILILTFKALHGLGLSFLRDVSPHMCSNEPSTEGDPSLREIHLALTRARAFSALDWTGRICSYFRSKLCRIFFFFTVSQGL